MMPAIASPSPPNVSSVEPIVSVLRSEWSGLSDVHPNILLVGDRMATDAALSYLQSAYQPPVMVRHCGGHPLVLPPNESVNTLILHDVAALLPAEQQMLIDRRTQVVTTSPEALLPLVASGAFLSMLYYRLNVIYVDLTNSPARIEPAAMDV